MLYVHTSQSVMFRGLMTYGEDFCLWDPNTGTPEDKELASSVGPHEHVHVWFGDYVTLDWWSRMWLNEGFATYLSDCYGIDDSNSEMEQKSRFTMEEMHGALEVDSSPDTHAVNAPIDNPEGVESVIRENFHSTICNGCLRASGCGHHFL